MERLASGLCFGSECWVLNTYIHYRAWGLRGGPGWELCLIYMYLPYEMSLMSSPPPPRYNAMSCNLRNSSGLQEFLSQDATEILQAAIRVLRLCWCPKRSFPRGNILSRSLEITKNGALFNNSGMSTCMWLSTLNSEL